MIEIVGFLIASWCYASLAMIAIVFWVWSKEERGDDGVE